MKFKKKAGYFIILLFISILLILSFNSCKKTEKIELNSIFSSTVTSISASSNSEINPSTSAINQSSISSDNGKITSTKTTSTISSNSNNGGTAIVSQYVLNNNIWKTPLIDSNGFVFEVQVLNYEPYNKTLVKNSIKDLNLGESKKIPCNAAAEEWANTFYFGDQKGFTNNKPATRQAALDIMKNFLNNTYIKGANHPWKSITGHLTYQHYAAEFGFDIIGSEIGCLVKGYQMTLAFNRGAARQYNKPWFVDVSPWFDGAGMLDYSGQKIWGDASGDTFGHSLSLLERSYYMSYMSGASWLVAEAGGCNFFYPQIDDNGNYKLSPLGEIGKEFNNFAKANSDIGTTYAPFGILLDYYHGTNYGSVYLKKAFEYFPYNDGDNITYSLIDKFFPDSWQTWYRPEKGALTNSPYGDTCDIILQNASQEVINSYPVIILSGDIKFSSTEAKRIENYVKQGGTLVINSAYLNYFPVFKKTSNENRYDIALGKGNAIVYGPNYDLSMLDSILKSLAEKFIPFTISGKVEYILNIKNNSLIVTIINNEGVTKESTKPTVVDRTKSQKIDVNYKGKSMVKWVKDLRTGKALKTDANQSIYVGPGDLVIIEFGF